MSLLLNRKISLNNQVSSGSSKCSLILSSIEFKESENEDTYRFYENLKSKYNHLTTDKFKDGNHKEATQLNGVNNKVNCNNKLNLNNEEEKIFSPKIMIANEDKMQLNWKQIRKVGAGLTNLGNTCFMNSVLQCLSYIPPLVNYLLYADEDQSTKCKISTFCMTCELQKHIKNLYQGSGSAIRPNNIYQRLRTISKHFQYGRQEDAHEFLRYVIDHMWKSSTTNYEQINRVKLDPFSKRTSIINHIFGGYMRSQVICSMCKEKSDTFDYFMDVILDIKNIGTLEKALEKFVMAETLQNENAYKCLKCKKKVTAQKRFTIHIPPNVATFQFKRFDYNRIFGGKITKQIAFPETLNIRPYMSDSNGPPIQYKLNGVLVHLGQTTNSGHYFCYVRNSNSMWYLCDDSRVVQVSLNHVLNQQAYILMYVKILSSKPSNPVLKELIKPVQPLNENITKITPKIIPDKPKIMNTINNTKQNEIFAKIIPKVIPDKPKVILDKPKVILDKPKIINTINNTKQNGQNLVNGDVSVNGLKKPNINGISNGNKNGHDENAKITNGFLSNNLHKKDQSETNELETSKSENHNKKNIDKVKLSNDSIKNDPKEKDINENQKSIVIKETNIEEIKHQPMSTVNGMIKAKATGKWVVTNSSETRSPSLNSGSSANSYNSTTSWVITNQDIKNKQMRNGENLKMKDTENCEKIENKKLIKKPVKLRFRSSSSDSSSSSEYELEWVERTKETVDEERKKLNSVPIKKWDEKVVNVKDKFNYNYVDPDTANFNFDSLRTYGSQVCSWDGEPNKHDKTVNDENRMTFHEFKRKEYDDEIDTGKIKKTKKDKELTKVDKKINEFKHFRKFISIKDINNKRKYYSKEEDDKYEKKHFYRTNVNYNR